MKFHSIKFEKPEESSAGILTLDERDYVSADEFSYNKEHNLFFAMEELKEINKQKLLSEFGVPFVTNSEMVGWFVNGISVSVTKSKRLVFSFFAESEEEFNEDVQACVFYSYRVME